MMYTVLSLCLVIMTERYFRDILIMQEDAAS